MLLRHCGINAPNGWLCLNFAQASGRAQHNILKRETGTTIHEYCNYFPWMPQKNQVDADVFCHALIKAGHQTVADPEQADIIIVNTCGFIQSAKEEAIENILMACQYKQQNPNLKVIVTGCLAERYKTQIVSEMPEVDAVVGIGSNAALPAIVERLTANGAGQVESYGPKCDMELGGARVISTPRHYAYLKIAEGCNNRCHYCAIPLIRGPLRSRPIDDCVAEARWLAGEGVKKS